MPLEAPFLLSVQRFDMDGYAGQSGNACMKVAFEEGDQFVGID